MFDGLRKLLGLVGAAPAQKPARTPAVMHEPRQLPGKIQEPMRPIAKMQPMAPMGGQQQLQPWQQGNFGPGKQQPQRGQGVWSPYGIQDANQAIKRGQPFMPQANVYGDMIDQGLTPHMDPQLYGYPEDIGQYR